MAETRTVLLISVMLLALSGLGNTALAQGPSQDSGGQDRPLDPEYEALQEELGQLMEEMKRLEQEIRTKVRRELLPRIRQEVERLRKWLEELDLEKETPGPLKTRAGDPRPA